MVSPPGSAPKHCGSRPGGKTRSRCCYQESRAPTSACSMRESRDAFQKRLKARGSQDVAAGARPLSARSLPFRGSSKEQTPIDVASATRTRPGRDLYQAAPARRWTRRSPRGNRYRTRPESLKPEELSPTFTLPDSVAISGKWKDLDTSTWKDRTKWGQELNLPAADVLDVKFRGGKVTFLSDLTPSRVEETPYFGHRLPWRRDVNLLGEPLKINGQSFDRGLAVHSRCILTYDLQGHYSRFEALLGFDDYSRGKGRVDCRVYAPIARRFTPIPTSAPTRLRSSYPCRSMARLSCDFKWTSAVVKILATA